MNEIKIEKHTTNTLKFIFEESDKFYSEVSNSITQSSNRSFLLFGLYLSIISFSFSKLITFEYEYSILFIGSIMSCLIIRKNLFPTAKERRGSIPKDIISEYFDNFEGEDLEKEYLATQIQSYNTSIGLNLELVDKMTKNYIRSFLNLIVFLILFVLIFFLSQINCFIT